MAFNLNNNNNNNNNNNKDFRRASAWFPLKFLLDLLWKSRIIYSKERNLSS